MANVCTGRGRVLRIETWANISRSEREANNLIIHENRPTPPLSVRRSKIN
jgi:hypothetical protein